MVMNRSVRHRSLIWQSALTVTVIVAALVWGTYKAGEPLQRIDLQLAAQSLHSYAAEGMLLAQQSAADHVFRRYRENETQFVKEKVDDVALMLSRKDIGDENSRLLAQERAAAQSLRLQLNTLSQMEEPAELRFTATRLSELSSQLADLAERLASSSAD